LRTTAKKKDRVRRREGNVMRTLGRKEKKKEK
jgi:hypothetical protein